MGSLITVQGREYRLLGDPIENYWKLNGGRPSFEYNVNPAIKGYNCSWELRGERLFLIQFTGKVWRLFQPLTEVSFSEIFPGKTLPWFADWFTGTMVLQVGKLKYWSHHFGSTLEYEIEMHFDGGQLVACEMRDS